MILLAVDSSGREGSLALARAEASGLQILEAVALDGGNFSAQLVPQIGALLKQHGFILRDVGGFAVAVGPGSFTGLRVGLAAIKGLAEALQKPIAAVSRLEAVARGGGRQGRVIAALDAGRREVFLGEYEFSGELSACIREQLLSWEEAAAIAADQPIVTPEKSVFQGLRDGGVATLQIQNPGAEAIARIGWKKMVSGDVAEVATLEANYIRRTDAEILIHGK